MPSSGWIYDEVLNIWGPTATIIPVGAPIGSIPGGLAGENTDKTTVRTYPGASGLDATFTYTGAISTWAKQPYTKGVYHIPFVRPSGVTNDKATAPDDNYWSFNNNPGTNTDKAFSIGFICKPPLTVSGDNAVLSRLNVGEYYVSTQEGAAKVNVVLRDLSAASATPRRVQDVAYTLGVIHTFAVTYDGGGGATAADGIAIYVDGVVVASTPTNNASYVAMENGAGVTLLFHRTALTGFAADDVAGGPFGPVVSISQVSAADILRWDSLWRRVTRRRFFDPSLRGPIG